MSRQHAIAMPSMESPSQAVSRSTILRRWLSVKARIERGDITPTKTQLEMVADALSRLQATEPQQQSGGNDDW